MSGRTVGRILFVVGLGGWVFLSLRALPFDYTDLCYLFALEKGRYLTQEWVHPLYVPFLCGYRTVLHVFGFSGRMLLPVERLNILAGAATLTGLFVIAERWFQDSPGAALSVLLLGFSHGYWTGALRATPYALAAACVVACFLLLLGSSKHGYAWAGAAAGLGASFHASVLVLALVAAFAARRAGGREGRRLFRGFAAAMIALLCVGYGLFLRRDGIGPDFIGRLDFLAWFHGIEQVRGTSIYSSRQPLGQLLAVLWTLREQAGSVLLILACAAAADFSRRSLEAAPRTKEMARLALGVFLAFILFFAINNSRNGFVYAAVLPIPAALSCLFSRARNSRRALLMAAAFVSLASSAFRFIRSDVRAAKKDPILSESRFLSGLLGSSNILLTPGCPFEELSYEHELNIFRIADSRSAGLQCATAPTIASGDALNRKVASWLGGGGRVFLARAAVGGDSTGSGDESGDCKKRHIFFPCGPVEGEAVQDGDLAQALLSRKFTLYPLVSPQGWAYREIAPKAAYRGSMASVIVGPSGRGYTQR